MLGWMPFAILARKLAWIADADDDAVGGLWMAETCCGDGNAVLGRGSPTHLMVENPRADGAGQAIPGCGVSPLRGNSPEIFFGFFGTETKGVTGSLHIVLNEDWLKI